MSIAGILFDLEGVLLQAKTHEVLPGAKQLLERCIARELPFAIISNNTVELPETMFEILRERGFAVRDDQFLTPLKFLQKELVGVRSALVIGSENLRRFVEAHGALVREAPDVDAVICGGGYEVSTSLLSAACSALIESGARFICLHRNRLCQNKTGQTVPDVGCVVTGLEYSTGLSAKTLGKPSPEYFQEAIRGWDVAPEKILLISDDPISDLGGGKALGFQTAFVHTGKYGPDCVAGLKTTPDFSWQSLNEALELLARPAE